MLDSSITHSKCVSWEIRGLGIFWFYLLLLVIVNPKNCGQYVDMRQKSQKCDKSVTMRKWFYTSVYD